MTEQASIISICGWNIYERVDGIKGPWISSTELTRHLDNKSIDVTKEYKKYVNYFKEGKDTLCTDIEITGRKQRERLFSEKGVLKLVYYLGDENGVNILTDIYDILLAYKKGTELYLEEHTDILALISYQAKLISQLAEEIRKDRRKIEYLQEQVLNLESSPTLVDTTQLEGVSEPELNIKNQSVSEAQTSTVDLHHTEPKVRSLTSSRNKTEKRDLISAIIKRRDDL